jgi:hypothetical protein
MIWPLLLGTGILIISVLSYAIANAVIVHLLVRMIRVGYVGRFFWKNVLVMMLLMMVTAAAHLTEIFLWATAFLACGEISTFEKAFYFSAENYTSLGYGDVVLSERWRLLGPFEAMNGLLLFGLSTALMFAVMSRLIADRLRFRYGLEIEPLIAVEPRSTGVGTGPR